MNAKNCLHIVYSLPSARARGCHHQMRLWVGTWRSPEGPVKIARIAFTIKLDTHWNSFQLATSARALSVTNGAVAPSTRIPANTHVRQLSDMREARRIFNFIAK